MYETIKYSVHDQVATIILNRPKNLNAFTLKMNHEITTAIKQAEKDITVRVIVITGEGRAFCSGQDLSEVTEKMDHGDVLRTRYGPMIKQIHCCEKPIIAAVNGVAAGAGFSLALACDFRLLSEKASYVQAFIQVGLIPDSGNLFYLSKIVGYAKALEISIFGERINAEQSLKLGLANKVIQMDSWEDEVAAYTKHIAKMPTKAIGIIKRTLKSSYDLTFNEFLEREAFGQRIVGLTNDHREGVTSFLEKREPSFSGN